MRGGWFPSSFPAKHPHLGVGTLLGSQFGQAKPFLGVRFPKKGHSYMEAGQMVSSTTTMSGGPTQRHTHTGPRGFVFESKSDSSKLVDFLLVSLQNSQRRGPPPKKTPKITQTNTHVGLFDLHPCQNLPSLPFAVPGDVCASAWAWSGAWHTDLWVVEVGISQNESPPGIGPQVNSSMFPFTRARFWGYHIFDNHSQVLFWNAQMIDVHSKQAPTARRGL